jgi:uncharacterized protein YndB with AHSA1/START domain
MGKLLNEVIIEADIAKVWSAFADPGLLDKYDPTVKRSTIVSAEKTGLNTKRKVDMLDGKNWFEEKITEFVPHRALAYLLTDCSFPIKGLSHSYKFEAMGTETKITQIMVYSVKFGLFGKLLDALLMRQQFDRGVKKFFHGLKSYIEST